MDRVSIEVLGRLLVNDGQFMDLSESNTIEFKSQFNWGDNEFKAKIAKAIAGMCNADGGYLIFGVDDSTKQILGVNGFDKIDLSTFTSYLNQYFSPSIKTQKNSIVIAGKTIGILYVNKYHDIPSVCIKTLNLGSKDVLKDGAIYCRHSAMSEIIRGHDLIHLLHSLKGGESRELLEFEKSKQKREARPRLILKSTYSEEDDATTIQLNCINDGDRAFLKGIKILSGDYQFHCNHMRSWIEKNSSFVLNGTTDGISVKHASTAFGIIYTDDLGNPYTAFWGRKDNKWITSEGVELK